MMLFIYFLSLAFSSEVVSDNDIVMTKQTYGECRRDLSVDGNKLTIGGKQYEHGIGTHATSMIPITVPQNTKTLTGACGIDDEAKNDPAVIFQISSGSEVLWSQLKKRGEEASTFSVEIPSGATKLYLLAGELDTTKNVLNSEPNKNDNDHADWVNLQWGSNTRKSKRSTQHPTLPQQYYPETNENDYGPTLRKLLTIARSDPGSTIIIPKGEYHFYAAGALKLSFHVSNHDQPTFQPVAIPLIDLKDVTLDCGDSVFYFHDLLQPIVVLDSQNVTIKNVKIDYFRPFYTQAVVTETGFFTTTVRIDKEVYPYHVSLGRFVFEYENFTQGIEGVTLYKKSNKMIIAGTGDSSIIGLITENDDGTCTIAQNLQGKGVEVGDIINFHTNSRPYPAITLYRALGTILENVHICDSQGMAVLSQRSEDITFINSGVEYSDESRFTSSHCDAVHFSNCRGRIHVENSVFEGMLDDSINVHCTSLRITSIDGSKIGLQYMHGQSVGFETFLPNEHVQFIKSKTLELSEIRKVVNVRKLATNKIEITIEGSVPSGISVGDAVENSDYYPSVVFKNNTVRNNRARGTLFTTPKDVIVEDNVFDYTSGSALLLAGDAANWYESGACRNVIIRRNRIINALTSSYQFTNAIFSFCPSISDVVSQKQFYHTNVVIEDNYIETFDVPLLYAISSANVEFRNNQIVYNDDYPSWGKKAFLFNKVSNITIAGNTVSPTKTFTIDDVSLTNTDQSEIHFE